MINFSTVAEAIANIGSFYPENGFTFQDLSGNEVFYSLPRVAVDTARRAAGLQRLGLTKGDRLGLIIIEPEQFVLTFLAALRIGVIPVPIYPPPYLGLDNYLRQTACVLTSASSRILLASYAAVRALQSLSGNVKTLERIVTVEELCGDSTSTAFEECAISADDPVFVQYTSGSTAAPRGIVITHRNVLSNVQAFVTSGLQVDPLRDKGVTWLPLFHDMGLVGFVLAPICCGVSVVFIPTMRFIKSPRVWLDTLHAHRGTISFAPNFAFNLAVQRASDEQLQSWDLSCVRALGCGAEPIHPDTIRQFARIFSQCDLSPHAILPAYGLAESTLAVTMKPLHEPVKFRCIDRSAFETEGLAQEVTDRSLNLLEHVSCGAPFPHHQLAIMDRRGDPLVENMEGEICLRGPSVAETYVSETGEFRQLLRNGWFHTGDLGYLAQDHLYVTGRIKDLIIINGRNIHPQTIEWAASSVPAVKKGSVAAFSRPGRSGEELVLVAEARACDTEHITAEIEAAVQQAIFTKPAEIVCVKPGSLPRTSSGKLKRHQVREQYLRHAPRLQPLR